MTIDSSSDAAQNSQLLTALLRHFDWVPTGGNASHYDVWEPEADDDEGGQVIIPLDPIAGDYNYLIDKARRQIIGQYGREARQIIKTIEMRIHSGLELTQWKKETSLTSGVIDWEGGEELYASAKNQLLASAKATKEPRRYHGNASPYIARRFLESSYMGQTGAGSFIISAYTPSSSRIYVSKHAEATHGARPRQAESYSGTQILDTYVRSLTAVRQGLEAYRSKQQIEVFLEAAPDGVSYELTKALSLMAAGSDSSIKIVRQGIEGNATPVEYSFEPVDAIVLERAANAFVQDVEPLRVTLIGEVTLLSRPRDASNGVVKLEIEEGADIRGARIRLSAEQYTTALDAHSSESYLRLTGRLEKEGRLYWLYDATDLEILPADYFGSVNSSGYSTGILF